MAQRRKGSRNWARGVFATFWILLAGVSGLYLFSAFSDPTLGGQLVKFAPISSGETTAAVSVSSGQELTEIKASLRELTQQVAALTARLDSDGNVAEPDLPAAAAEAPSLPAQSPSPKTAAAPADPAPPPEEEPSPAQAEVPAPAETVQPEAKPIEQAAIDVREPAPATPEAAPAPKPYEPPPVVVAPFEPPAEEEPAAASSEVSAAAPPSPAAEETESPAAGPAPEPEPAVTESAALDPIALPPAANDGSTRFGIEIGSVAKQDGLRPLWREFLTNHAALVAGLQPRRVLAPDKKWRLIAGPFGSAAEAAQACALFKKAARPCEATVYAGDSL
jgi:SPOR domain